MACLNSLSDRKVVKSCLDRGVDVDIRDTRTGNTPLIATCKNGHVDIVDLVLSRGARVNLQNKIGWSALMVASRCGHGDVVKLLIDKDAEVNMQDDEGMSALMIVSLSGLSDIVKLLIDKGADVNIQDNIGLSPLMKASLNGHNDIVELLIDKGADVNMQDKQGRSALMIACFHGQMETARLLIENQADIDLEDILGRTVLDIALAQGHADIVYILYPVEVEETDNIRASVHAESNEVTTETCTTEESTSPLTDNQDPINRAMVDASNKPHSGHSNHHEQKSELADSKLQGSPDMTLITITLHYIIYN